MKYFSIKEISKFSTISEQELRKRCKILQILPTFRTLDNRLIYKLNVEDIGKVLLFTLTKLPEKITNTIIYNVYESKINNETDTNTITKNT